MAKFTSRSQVNATSTEEPVAVEKVQIAGVPVAVYSDSPKELNFITLQNNLQNCLSIVDNEVMKNYISTLQNCSVVPLDDEVVKQLKAIQFFRITELVYQEDEFSVHKIATAFNALSSKPCTLVLMIQSDGIDNNFYLGVRPRDSRFSEGTMRQLLEQSLLGLFPGSSTAEYLQENMVEDLGKLNIQAVSSVTCIADYKQDKDSFENKDFIQGLEKFIYGMQGKAFTAVCIANNLEHCDLVETRKEYERIYTLMSPFANMQYNYALNKSSATTESDTQGNAETDTTGTSIGSSVTDTSSRALQLGTNQSHTITDTSGQNASVGVGQNKTVGVSDGVTDSETKTKTVGTYVGKSKSIGINIKGVSAGSGVNYGVSSSVSRAKTHGTTHTNTVSDSVSKNLTFGLSSSKSIGNAVGQNQSVTDSNATAVGTQQGENQSHSISSNTAHTTALSETFGTSQAATLNVQNKSLINTLQRLEKQLERIDECESIGMWDFAAYFLGESAAEAETAASMYRSLVSGNQSGLEVSAVNTWTDEEKVKDISKYVVNFIHPVFLYEFLDSAVERRTYVDATALASTNELAIQLGLPRKSVKGLPVVEHADFGKEIIKYDKSKTEVETTIELGEIFNMGRTIETTKVALDIESLSMHTFIVGATGSGKSNTVYTILEKLTATRRDSMTYMVIEPAKGEYKRAFGHKKDVSVFGTNPEFTRLLKINPFKFPKGIHVLEHIDRLIEIFNVCWPLYAAMPAVLKDAILSSYSMCGWDLTTSKNSIADDLYPTFQDLLEQLVRVINESGYSDEVKSNYIGSLTTRVKSLTNGLNGQIFSSNEISNDILFDSNVIIDLSRVGSQETKSLLMGILVIRLSEHRMSNAKESNSKLRHITVLEEAHNLLGSKSDSNNVDGSNIAGKSVEMLSNAIAEMRTYGEGFIIADQSPGAVDISAIRNTNTKIIMRLPEENDRRISGKAAALKDNQVDEIARLPKGVAVVYQNDWVEPVLCKIDKFNGKEEDFIEPSIDGNSAVVKEAASTLFNFIAYKRLDAPDRINAQRVLDAIQRAECTVRTKTILYSLLKEYKNNGQLRIWSDERLSDQAKLVTDVLGLKGSVEEAQKTSFDNLGFSCRLNTMIAQKLSRVTDDVLITASHYLVKAFSETETNGLEFYKLWVETILHGRDML